MKDFRKRRVILPLLKNMKKIEKEKGDISLKDMANSE